MKQFCLAVSLLLLVAAGHSQTGNITSAGSTCSQTNCVTVSIPSSLSDYAGSVGINLDGTFSATVQFELCANPSPTGCTATSSDWSAAKACVVNDCTTTASSATAKGNWQVPVGGFRALRVRGSSYSSGTAIVGLNPSPAPSARGGGGGGGGGDTVTSPNGTISVGGDSSNTTVDVAGGAGQIMAGATPALTATPALGTDGSVAGTLQLANSAATFHSILSSGATANNTVKLPATVPTNLHALYCAVASTTCTLTDTGYAYNAIPLADLAAQAADTVLTNATGGSAAPTAVAWPTSGTNGCAGSTDGLIYNTTTHALGCHQTAGSGTVNSGTATHLGYYATTAAAISDAGADLVFDGTHTYSAASTLVFNLAGATGTAAFKVPSNSSNTATAAGVIDYDSTGKNYHIFANSADAILAPFASAPTTGHCVQATVSGGNVLLSDSGSSNCGGGGSVAWSGISNPSGNLALSMGTNTSIFTGTAATNQFFAFKNSTAAVVGTSQGSPILSTCGRAFHGSADVEDCLTLGELPGNGNDAAITFTVGHTGTSTGTVTTTFPGPVQAGSSGGVGGTVDMPEGTAPSGISGHELIYGDSTAHRAKMNNNAGTADTVVGAATTDTFTNKTYDTAGSGNSFSINGVAATANTGTGSVVRATSPTLVTPTIGVATATSVNKMAITAPATSSTLAVADGKTLTANNSITLAGTDSTTMTFPSVSATIPRVVASGTSAMGTSAISSGTCATVVTTSATGTLTTDAIIATPNADPTGVTGYAVSATGGVYIAAYPTADNVNFKVCNNTSGSLTPSALTMNWRVIR